MPANQVAAPDGGRITVARAILSHQQPPRVSEAFGSLVTQHESVLQVDGGAIVAAAEPNLRGDLAKLVADVAKDGGVRGILHHEARLAVEPARHRSRTIVWLEAKLTP